jgi:hypothetical protein
VSCYHELGVLDQFASSFKLGEKQTLLGFVRKGHVFFPRDLTYGIAPSAGYTYRKTPIDMKYKFVLGVGHRWFLQGQG